MSSDVQVVICVAMTKVALICDALLCMCLCYVKSMRNAMLLKFVNPLNIDVCAVLVKKG